MEREHASARHDILLIGRMGRQRWWLDRLALSATSWAHHTTIIIKRGECRHGKDGVFRRRRGRLPLAWPDTQRTILSYPFFSSFFSETRKWFILETNLCFMWCVFQYHEQQDATLCLSLVLAGISATLLSLSFQFVSFFSAFLSHLNLTIGSNVYASDAEKNAQMSGCVVLLKNANFKFYVALGDISTNMQRSFQAIVEA